MLSIPSRSGGSPISFARIFQQTTGLAKASSTVTTKASTSLASSDLDGASSPPGIGIGPKPSLETANYSYECQPKNWKTFSEVNYD